MVTRRSKPNPDKPRNPDAPRGQLDAFARRVGGLGYTITPHALFRFREKLGLEKLDLLVLLAILSHASPKATDFACASYEVLASDTGLDRKTVVRRAQRLRDDLKLLTWTNTRRPDKSLTANIYDVRPLAQKLKAVAAGAPPDGADEGGFDSIMAELMAEPGPDMDLADAGGVEVPATSPRKRKGSWATKEKDPFDDGRDDERADRSAGRSIAKSVKPRSSSRRAATPRSPSPSASGETASRIPWFSGSRMRSPELDEPDRAQLERGERLRHPDSRELTLYEHIQRMREMGCYSRDEQSNLLMGLKFPNAGITTAMNASPVEFIGGLAGALPATPEPARKAEGPYLEPMPPEAELDPELKAGIQAINAARLRRWRKEHGQP